MGILDYIERIKRENEGPRITAQEPRIGLDDGGVIGKPGGLVEPGVMYYSKVKMGPAPEKVMGVDNPNYRFLNKKQKNIARTLYKDEIKKYGSVEKWAADSKNKHKKSAIVLERTTLESKPTGIIVDDPNRISVKSKRGSSIVTDVVFPDKKMPSGKTMKEQFIIDLKERFETPRGRGNLQNIDLVKKYPISKRQVQRAVNYYIPKYNLKYPKGKTSIESQSYQARKKRIGPVTDITVEETIAKKIKRPILVEKGMIRKSGTVEKGVIDFAHRISKTHARELGIQFGTETTGFDSRLINQIIVKPSEIRLERFYTTQRNILDKIKTSGLTKEFTEEMNTINNLINKEVEKTSGRLIGVNIDPNTLEISFTGQKKKFKLSNLDKTFKELKEVPVKERNKILTKEIEKSVGAEIKRGFRPHDFKEILGDPRNRQSLLKYTKEHAPDIFSKFKNILSNPMSRRRFALYSKFPAVAIPAGLIMALSDQSGQAQAAEAEAAETGTIADKSKWLFESGLTPLEKTKVIGTAAIGDVLVNKAKISKAFLKGLPFIWTPAGDALMHKLFSDKEPKLEDFAEGLKEGGYDINSEEFKKAWNTIPKEDRKEMLYDWSGKVIDKRSTGEKVSEAAASPWTHAQYAFWKPGVEAMKRALQYDPGNKTLAKKWALRLIRMGVPMKVISVANPIGWALTGATAVNAIREGTTREDWRPEPLTHPEWGGHEPVESAQTVTDLLRGYQEKHVPKDQRDKFTIDYSLPKNYAGGGLANLTTTVAPDSGPMSQGLRSLYIDDMDY